MYSRAPTLPNPAPDAALRQVPRLLPIMALPRYAQVYSPAQRRKNAAAAAWTPIAASVKPSAPETPYESAASLPDFYGALRKDTLYANATKFAAGLGKDSRSGGDARAIFAPPIPRTGTSGNPEVG